MASQITARPAGSARPHVRRFPAMQCLFFPSVLNLLPTVDMKGVIRHVSARI
jgi:hypothetical protein